MPKVVLILKKVIPGMSYKRVTQVMYEALRIRPPAVFARWGAGPLPVRA